MTTAIAATAAQALLDEAAFDALRKKFDHAPGLAVEVVTGDPAWPIDNLGSVYREAADYLTDALQANEISPGMVSREEVIRRRAAEHVLSELVAEAERIGGASVGRRYC